MKPGGWVVKEHWVDHEKGSYVAHLQNLDTGAEHKLQIMLNALRCPTCLQPLGVNNLDEHDPHAHTVAKIKELNAEHAQRVNWQRKHRVPSRKKK